MFTISQLHSDNVTVDDKPISLPYFVDSMFIRRVAHNILISGFEGVRIKWDGRNGVYVRMDESMRNSTCGLCGNFNGILDDDLKTKGGAITTSVARFANSWSEPDINEVCRNIQEKETISPCSKKNVTEMMRIRGTCGILKHSPFRLCHGSLNPQHYIEMCEQDACSCDITSYPNCVCDSFTQYERACARKGITVTWRSSDLCRKLRIFEALFHIH